LENPAAVLCDFHFTTIGGAISLSPYVAGFVNELSRRGIKHQLHAFGTNLECNLEELCSLASWVIDFLESQGESRVFLDMRVTARFDRDQDIEEKIRAVTDKLGG
jgi:uncharacterized protein (TIGR00106 family)